MKKLHKKVSALSNSLQNARLTLGRTSEVIKPIERLEKDNWKLLKNG